MIIIIATQYNFSLSTDMIMQVIVSFWITVNHLVNFVLYKSLTCHMWALGTSIMSLHLLVIKTNYEVC